MALQSKQRLVLCVGDSQTHGTAGSSYVNRLANKNKHLKFVVSAMNGAPSETIAKRLPPFLQQYPDPAAVLIMAGSNDCLEQENSQLHAFYSIAFGIARPCTVEVFYKNVAGMVETVQAAAPRAKIVVITCPPLTEQPTHPAFLRTLRYNTTLKELLSKNYPDVHVVDFHSTCLKYLESYNGSADQPQHQQQQQQQQKLYSFSIPSVLWWQPTAVLSHYFLWRSWNSISEARGLLLLTDQVHINDTAADILAKDLQPCFEGL